MKSTGREHENVEYKKSKLKIWIISILNIIYGIAILGILTFYAQLFSHIPDANTDDYLFIAFLSLNILNAIVNIYITLNDYNTYQQLNIFIIFAILLHCLEIFHFYPYYREYWIYPAAECAAYLLATLPVFFIFQLQKEGEGGNNNIMH